MPSVIIAKRLVLCASPEKAIPVDDHFGDVQARKYQNDHNDWQVSATYTDGFLLGNLLSDKLEDLTVTLYAIHRSVQSAPDTEALGGERFYCDR